MFNGKERDRDELSTHIYTQTHTQLHTYIFGSWLAIPLFLLLFLFFCIRFIYFVHVLCPFLDTHTKWFSLFMLRQMQHEITKAKVKRWGRGGQEDRCQTKLREWNVHECDLHIDECAICVRVCAYTYLSMYRSPSLILIE